VLLAASVATAAQAATITVGGPLSLTDLSSLPVDDGGSLPAGTTTFLLGHELIAFDNSSKSYPESGVYAGTFPNIAVSPYGGQSQSTYLVAQAGDPVAISLGGTYTEFALLWGTVDSYNRLDFYKGGTKVASVSGDDVLPGADNGTQNVYVMISDLPNFDTVVAVDIDQPAFEFVPDAPVPEPASAALLGVGLLGFGFTQLVRRRI
jgi:hypothetical protein